MAQARELRRRIRSVQSTRQITKTMEMVATSKLKRAQDRVVAARPYAQALAEVLGDLYAPDRAERFPLLRQPGPEGIRRVAVLLCTANRGLCGAFNANLIREARRRIAELEAQGAQVELHLVGKKGVGFFKYSKRPIASQRTDIGDRPSAEHAQELIAPLLAQFEAGALDAVDVVYARFNSAIATPPTVQRVLPVEPVRRSGGPADASGAAATADYILTPSADAILEQLLPLYVRNQIYRALVETAAGFYGAQRTAMKNATDNAGEMLDLLRRTYNRARQAQITQELAEIVGGAEALNG
ncbi:MAG TPA: F0F1 ATP synthase subunit gamma [Gemmatimonadales bacterium]